jgi:hypothetical protein
MRCWVGRPAPPPHSSIPLSLYLSPQGPAKGEGNPATTFMTHRVSALCKYLPGPTARQHLDMVGGLTPLFIRGRVPSRHLTSSQPRRSSCHWYQCCMVPTDWPTRVGARGKGLMSSCPLIPVRDPDVILQSLFSFFSLHVC